MALLDHDNHLNGSLWGLVLAAGDGRRLGGYVRELKGMALPKQYVNVIGRRSMLEHTFDRAQRLIPASRILTIISENHLTHTEALKQIASRPAGTVILQPENKETGPGVLLPLMHLYKRCPEAVVALFPSDHFVLEEGRFIDHVALAAQAVARNPDRIVLLATEARSPETEFGYVVPCDEGGQLSFWGARRVAHFAEKPDLDRARKLAAAGALWNTMVMVFKAKNLLNLIRALYPELYQRFYGILDVLGESKEKARVKELYRNLKPLNFSKEIVQRLLVEFPGTVYVLPMLNIFWSDWGSPQRIINALQALGVNTRGALRTPLETAVVRQARRRQGARDVLAKQSQIGQALEGNRKWRCATMALTYSRLFCGAIVWSAFFAVLAYSAGSQTVRERSEIAPFLAIEKLSVQDGVVAGEIVNRSPHMVRDVQVLIRYTWLWDEEFKPGKDDPGKSIYYTLPKEIPAGGRLPFNYSPSPPLPKASGGHFETTVAIAGFAEVIPQAKQ